MLPSSQKVSRSLFKPIMLKGRRYASTSFNAIFFDSNQAGKPKFSVVVPKKVEKSAVRRNYMKRAVYSSVRGLLKGVRPGVACIIFMKKKVERADFKGLNDEVSVFLKKTLSIL